MDAGTKFSNEADASADDIFPEDWKAGHAQSGGTSAHTLVPSILCNNEFIVYPSVIYITWSKGPNNEPTVPQEIMLIILSI